jgi:hypothetical protein
MGLGAISLRILAIVGACVAIDLGSVYLAPTE